MGQALKKPSKKRSPKKRASGSSSRNTKKSPSKTRSATKVVAKKKSAAKSKQSKPSNKIKALSRSEINAMVVDNREHGMRLAWSFLNKWRIRIESDEVESVVGAALVEAATRYDPNKGAHFRTFFFYHLRGMLLKEIAQVIDERQTIRHTPSELLENPNIMLGSPESWSYKLVESNNPESLLQKRQFSENLWGLCSSLDSLEREVIERHFIQDQSLKRIAEELQYCRCHISRVKSKAISTLSQLVPQHLLSERMVKKQSAASASKKYTGGRGRRKRSDEDQDVEIKIAANS